MLFVKLRSLGFTQSEFSKDPVNIFKIKFDNNDIKDILQKVEHNRWNTEKVLLGFRPLNEEEQKEFEEIRKKSQNYQDIEGEFKEKSKKYKNDKIHIDICSNKDLTKYDPNPEVKDYDIDINKQLGKLYYKTKEKKVS